MGRVRLTHCQSEVTSWAELGWLMARVRLAGMVARVGLAPSMASCNVVDTDRF